MEGAPFLKRRLHPNAATVPLHYLFANGQANARARVFTPGMEALEDDKQLVMVLGINANAIIPHVKVDIPPRSGGNSPNVDSGGF